MKQINDERRKYHRYDTKIEVYFKVKYDTRIKVKFRVVEPLDGVDTSPRHFGLCRNVSAEGLLVVSKKRLAENDILMLEVFDPAINIPVKMEGEVRWCKKFTDLGKEKGMFYSGVLVTAVNGKPVSDSIYFDKKYGVTWSVLLDSVFGSFAASNKASKKK